MAGSFIHYNKHYDEEELIMQVIAHVLGEKKLLQSYLRTLATVSHDGCPIGFIELSHGQYEVVIVSNPLKGRGHDPQQLWYDLSSATKANGLKCTIEAILDKAVQEGIIMDRPQVEQVQVGSPVGSMHAPNFKFTSLDS